MFVIWPNSTKVTTGFARFHRPSTRSFGFRPGHAVVIFSWPWNVWRLVSWRYGKPGYQKPNRPSWPDFIISASHLDFGGMTMAQRSSKLPQLFNYHGKSISSKRQFISSWSVFASKWQDMARRMIHYQSLTHSSAKLNWETNIPWPASNKPNLSNVCCWNWRQLVPLQPLRIITRHTRPRCGVISIAISIEFCKHL